MVSIDEARTPTTQRKRHDVTWVPERHPVPEEDVGQDPIINVARAPRSADLVARHKYHRRWGGSPARDQSRSW